MFNETVADGPRLFSALNNYHPAIALADSAFKPSWCVLRSGWFGRTFIGGEIGSNILNLVVQQLCKTGQVLLDLGDDHSSSFPGGATKTESRIEFYGRIPNDSSVDRLISSLPANFEVVPVQRKTFNKCHWRDQLLSVFGTASGYLERSKGFLLLDGEHIFSEAHAFFWGDKVVEIGTVTAAGHRGLGFASVVSAHLVKACENLGYATYWGCDVSNLASAAVARKLGYRVENSYTLAYYPAVEKQG